MFYLSHWKLDIITFQNCSFRAFANQTPVYHLIPPAQDTTVTTRLRHTTHSLTKTRFMHQKILFHLEILAYIISNQQSDLVTPSYVFVYLLQNFLFILFVLALLVCSLLFYFIIVVFICYSTAVFNCYLAPGRTDVNKLID